MKFSLNKLNVKVQYGTRTKLLTSIQFYACYKNSIYRSLILPILPNYQISNTLYFKKNDHRQYFILNLSSEQQYFVDGLIKKFVKNFVT